MGKRAFRSKKPARSTADYPDQEQGMRRRKFLLELLGVAAGSVAVAACGSRDLEEHLQGVPRQPDLGPDMQPPVVSEGAALPPDLPKLPPGDGGLPPQPDAGLDMPPPVYSDGTAPAPDLPRYPDAHGGLPDAMVTPKEDM